MILMQGKAVADNKKEAIKKFVQQAKNENKIITLAIVIVGEDMASQLYTNRLVKIAESLEIKHQVIALASTSTTDDVLRTIEKLSLDVNITGILPMMPMPKHIDVDQAVAAIAPSKDLECLNPLNVGLLYLGGRDYLAPCTPKAVMATLDFYNIDPTGKHVVIIGRSKVVGKPVAHLLLARNATVTVCHSKTKNLAEITKQADILVAAIGVANFVTPAMVKDDVVILDVGINEFNGKIVGDVSAEVQEKASAFTPVPGGIGTVSTTMVMETLINLK